MRLCPRCGAKTRIAGTLSGDVAKELCDECGYFRGLLAPEWAMGKRVEEARTPSPFTVIDGGGAVGRTDSMASSAGKRAFTRANNGAISAR